MEHSVWKISAIIATLVVFIVVCVINALSASGGTDLFLSTQVNLSDKYETPITPDGWTFSIWGFIYTWQALHILYGIILICRKNQDDYLYVDPDPIGTPFYITYIASGLCNVGWIFCFDREQLEAAMVFLIMIALSLYASIILAQHQLHKVGPAMVKKGLTKDIWATRILVHNGVAFYCAWTNVASLLNVVIVLQYRSGVDETTCAWIALGVITGIITLVYVLEVFVFDKYARYTLAHYITLVVAFSGILTRKYDSFTPYTNYLIFLAAFSGTLGISKLLITIYRAKNSNDLQTNSERVRYSDRSKVDFA